MTIDNAQPGFWPSDFSSESAVQGLTEYSQLATDGKYIYWVAYEPLQGGRVGLYRCTPAGEPTLITPENTSVCSRVHEYGGRSWCLAEGGWVYVSGADQQLWYQSPNKPGVKITHKSKGRFAAPVYDAKRHRIIAIYESHKTGKPVKNKLVAVSLPDGEVNTLHQGMDFYDCPTLSADGQYLAWISWSHPEQSWTQTSLWQISCDDPESSPRCVADPNAALTQPKYTAENRLMVLSDHNEFWHPYWVTNQGLASCGALIEGDACPAPWQVGGNNYQRLADGEWVFCEYTKGQGRLLLTQGDKVIHLAPEYSYVKSPVVLDNQVYVAASSPTQAYQIIAVDLDSHRVTVVSQSQQSLSAAQCIAPKPISIGQQGAQAWLYQPTQGKTGTPLPLLIFLHGGPTSVSYPQYNPKIQFWTQRGFAVADLNYRGSTSFGRTFRYALQ
ncbi:MAG: alpha/beta hydrolase family protein, partial [Pontibacterium sp.]